MRIWVAAFLLPCVVWYVLFRDNVEPADMHILWITRSSRKAGSDGEALRRRSHLRVPSYMDNHHSVGVYSINCSAEQKLELGHAILSCMGYAEQLFFTVCMFPIISTAICCKLTFRAF